VVIVVIVVVVVVVAGIPVDGRPAPCADMDEFINSLSSSTIRISHSIGLDVAFDDLCQGDGASKISSHLDNSIIAFMTPPRVLSKSLVALEITRHGLSNSWLMGNASKPCPGLLSLWLVKNAIDCLRQYV
jgi:hypothetical protein